MKTANILKISAVLVFTVTVFSGYSWFGGNGPEKDPEEIVREGISKLSDTKSASYALSFDGKAVAVTEDNAEMEELVMDVNLSGMYDNGERKAPKFTLKLNVAGSMDDGKEESANAELRLIDGNFYFVVSEISDFGGQIPSEAIGPLLGQWWLIALPEDFGSTFDLFSGEEAELTPEEKELKDLFKNTFFFKDVKYIDSKKINDADGYHYALNLDRSAVKNYLIESSKIQGEPLTAEDLTELEDFLALVNFDGDVWIGEEDATLRKLSGNLIIDDLEGFSTDFDVVYIVDNLNDPVPIDVPESAMEFDPFAMLGAPQLTEEAL